MARKQDTRTVKTSGTKKAAKATEKPAAKPAKPPGKPSAKGGTKTKAAASKTATAKSAAKTPKVAAGNRRKPASATVRMPVSKETSAPGSAKKALKSARAQAKALIADLPDLSVPHLPEKVTESVRAIGNQITSWLDSDLGRAMVAELLIYVAGQLTAKAQSAGAGTRDVVVKAGAEMGAAAADAGAKVVKAGSSVADAGNAMPDAGNLMRSVAQAAVGAVGGVVAEVAQKAIERRKGGGSSKKGKKAR